jgi:hypothetical protein
MFYCVIHLQQRIWHARTYKTLFAVLKYKIQQKCILAGYFHSSWMCQYLAYFFMPALWSDSYLGTTERCYLFTLYINIGWEILRTMAVFKFLRDRFQLHTLEVRFPMSRRWGKMLHSYCTALNSTLNILTVLPVRNYVRAPSFIRRSRFSQNIQLIGTHRQSTQTYYTSMLNLMHTKELNYDIFKIKLIVPTFDCVMVSVRNHFVCFMCLETLIIDLGVT